MFGRKHAAKSNLSKEELRELSHSTHFNEKEVLRLNQRFLKMDDSGTGTITKVDFCNMPELCMNPIVSKIADISTTDRPHLLNFRDFMKALNILSPLCTPEEKWDSLFRVLGGGNTADGKRKIEFLGVEHLEDYFRLVMNKFMSDDDLATIAASTLKCIQKNRMQTQSGDEAHDKDTFNLEDLKNVLADHQVIELLTVDF
jgi:Ca2+-binding EF-hand superfamily protein